MSGDYVTVSDANRLVHDNPKQYRAAMVEAPGTPLLDHPDATVMLYAKIGDATNDLRSRKEALVNEGWRVTWGNLGCGLMVFERDAHKRAIGVVKQPRKKGQSLPSPTQPH